MTSIKAIETRYCGARFRSRLEARWAVFLDSLALPWSYEPEGFELPSGKRYLPDFYLPSLDLWLEIKPRLQQISYDHPSGEGWEKFVECFYPATFASRHAEKMVLFDSSCEPSKNAVMLCGEPGPVEAYSERNSYEGFVPWDCSYYWCECPDCGALGVQFDGRSGRNKHTPGCQHEHSDKTYGTNGSRLRGAYAAARSARFGT